MNILDRVSSLFRRPPPKRYEYTELLAINGLSYINMMNNAAKDGWRCISIEVYRCNTDWRIVTMERML